MWSLFIYQPTHPHVEKSVPNAHLTARDTENWASENVNSRASFGPKGASEVAPVAPACEPNAENVSGNAIPSSDPPIVHLPILSPVGLSWGTMHWFHIIRPTFRHLPVCHSCSPCEKHCLSGLLLSERHTLAPPVTQPGCWPGSDLWHQVRGRFYSPLWAVSTAGSKPMCVAECHKDSRFGASAKPSQVPEPYSLGPGIRHVSLGGQTFRPERASPV